MPPPNPAPTHSSAPIEPPGAAAPDYAATALGRLLWLLAIVAAAVATSAYLADPYSEPLPLIACLLLHFLAWGAVAVEWRRSENSPIRPGLRLTIVAIVALLAANVRNHSFRCAPRGPAATYFTLEQDILRGDEAGVRAQLARPTSAGLLQRMDVLPLYDPANGEQIEPESLLKLSVDRDETDTAAELIEHGASLYTANGSIFAHAAAHGSVEMLRRLLRHGASLTAPYDNKTPLLQALDSGNVAAVRFLLEQDAPVDATAFDVVVAETSRSPEYAPLLPRMLANGAPVNACTDIGSVLRVAAAATNEDAVAFLLAHGANPNPPTGESPLIAAVRAGDTAAGFRILQMLVAHGAHINETGQRCDALWYAVGQPSIDEAQYLLDHGANPNAVDPDDTCPAGDSCTSGPPETVLQSAMFYDRLEDHQQTALITLLQDHGAKLTPP